MFDFIIRNTAIKSAQKYIDRLNPKINVHIPNELPMPSIGVVKGMCAAVSQVNALEGKVSQFTDEQLRAATGEFRKEIQKALRPAQEEIQKIEDLLKTAAGHTEKEELTAELNHSKEDLKKMKEEILKTILPDAFAVVREAARRAVGMRHFDVQLVGGMVLHEGKIAEMTTGEGKTLVATLAAYLNALPGYGVHIVTVNDYLANRDREWMGPVYEFLGLTVGVIQHDMDPRERQKSYACDITYGTNNEFGFDYLRDNMVNFKEEMAQRGHAFAIVDEVDSILIDEARTPLIISGPAEESTDKYYRANDISKQLKGRRTTEDENTDAKHRGEDLGKGFDYIADEKAKSISLTDQGEEKAARLFGVSSLYDEDTIEYRHHILQSLRAKEFFRIDVDYMTRDGKVVIVDEFTGRMMPGRRWSDGLHQAVEAKEGIKIERENQTLATITFQNYFRMYDKLSGMTGTAYTEANEFKQIYKLDCVAVPTNCILIRKNYADAIYKSAREKFNAAVEEIAGLNIKGQPVLVGTISIEKSELLSSMLKRKGISHQVLNAKYHDLEAHIVAQAGRFKAVTIATNMAGRGTDIVLGGNPEYLARSLSEQNKKDEKDQVESETLYKKFLEQFKTQCKEEHEKVVAAGGLHVLGTERHESRRIDNQLRGRSGRQGDPGSSRFYVSLEDDLMRLFGSDRIIGIMDKLGMEEGQVIEHALVSRAIEGAQKRVEGHNFEIRKHLLEYDNIMNKQREIIYSMRRAILEGEDTKERIKESIADAGHFLVEQYFTTEGAEGAQDVDGLGLALKEKFDYIFKKENLDNFNKDQIKTAVIDGLLAHFEEKEQSITAQHMRALERMFLLNTIDSKWKDHLYAMDQIKEGIGLRAYGQRDPLVEYQREAFAMFEAMYESINHEVAEIILKIQPTKAVSSERPKGVFSSLKQEFVHNEFSGLSDRAAQKAVEENIPGEGAARPAASPQPQRHTGPKVGRNDPCPCGSGKKYKKCCGK